jgi:hypothetical protein
MSVVKIRGQQTKNYVPVVLRYDASSSDRHQRGRFRQQQQTYMARCTLTGSAPLTLPTTRPKLNIE